MSQPSSERDDRAAVDRTDRTDHKSGAEPGRYFSGMAIVIYIAVFKLLMHFYFSLFSYYGYLRDELYFIDCGKHLDWGYVDIGPLTIWLGLLSRTLMGDNLFALRFFPALTGAAAIIVAGLIARELGGRRFAQALAALCVLVSPFWLGAQNNLCLPASEPLWWGLCALIFIRIARTDNQKLWLWFGLVAGIGLLNKPSMAFLGIGLVFGLLLTPQRRFLLNKYMWLGGLIALLVVLPYILWQIPRGWPTLQFLIGMNRGLMARIPAAAFLAGQLLYVNPFSLPIVIAGLVFFMFMQQGKSYRSLGWLYLFLLVALTVGKSKLYYILPVYMILLPAGAVVLEQLSRTRMPRLKWVAPAILIVSALLFAPIALPILPIERVDAYVTTATGGLLKNVYEINATSHDEIGWEEQVKVIADVYHSLTPEERADCVIFAGNFGKAGAVNFWREKYGLPEAYSAHQNYYFWGPPKPAGIFIMYGIKREIIDQFFRDVRQVATIEGRQAVEKNVPVYICRKPVQTLSEAWPSIRAIAFRN